MSKNEEKKPGKLLHKIMILFLIIALITSLCTIYSIFLYEGIESLIRYIIIGVIILYDLRLIFKCRKLIKGRTKKNKKPHKKLFIFWLFIYSLICFGIAFALNYVYDKVSGANKGNVTYTSYLVVMATNKANNINDIANMKLAMLNDTKNPDGYIIPQQMVRDNKLQDSNEIMEYDDYTSMLIDLYSGEIDGMFIPSSYVSMFSNVSGYEHIESQTKIVAQASKKMKKSSVSVFETASTGKSISEPFTILLMGIDSTDEVLEKNAIANGDTLILITFNPKTLNATMISIPRDSYVPIACWSGKPENKITHAAAYGNDCMINTIQNYFNVTIDYYAKINFKGLVKLVDAVGGVEVEVPKTLCTDDSSRGNEICINAGRQTLNGEQALVFARNRKAFADGDFARARHQQEIIMALVNKMKGIREIKTFMSILDTVSNSVDTNLTTKQILSFYDIGKDIIKKSLSSDDADLINIQQLFLQGTGQMIYDERARMVLWDYVPNNNSRQDIIRAMKVNLELEKHTDITNFSFSINEPYEKEIIGEGPYRSTGTYTLLPDFTGDSEAQARATASKLGISVTFKGTSGYVVDQNYPEAKRVDLIKDKVILTLSNGGSKVDKDDDSKLDDDTDKDLDNDNDDDNDNNNDNNGDDDKKDNDNNKPIVPSNPDSGNNNDQDNNTEEEIVNS